MSVARAPQVPPLGAPDISLTDFVDFVVRHGTARVTKVRQLRYRPEYLPSRDFWKPIRDGIRRFHEVGRVDRRELDRLLVGPMGAKAERYAAVLAAYKSWLGRKKIEWLRPPATTWTYRDLSVRVNPELGAQINGEPKTLIKLYFKKQEPSKEKVQVILQLMQVAIGRGWTSTFLDIPRKRSRSTSKPAKDAQLALESEADAFLRLWRGV